MSLPPRITADEQRSFLENLIRFVEAEAEAQKRSIDQLRALPVPERTAKGRAIESLCEAGEIEPKTFRFLCPANDARFRTGDMVCISRGDPRIEKLATGTLTSVEDTFVDIAITAGRVAPGADNLVLDEDTIDLTGLYKKAIARAAEQSRGRDRIIPLLMGRLVPSGPSAADLMQVPVLVKEGFTSRQAEAIVYATTTDLCHLIQGPPGTGKTRVIARIVRALIEQNPCVRILVTSFTHRAIDNALSEILVHGFDRNRLAKISQAQPDSDLPWFPAFRSSPWAGCDKGAYLIGATPFALHTRLDGVEFDWVIVDEASQVTLPLAVMAMLGGDRWIFAGDHKQMPPVTLSCNPTEAIQQSVFGRLQSGGFSTMLEKCRRTAYLTALGSNSWRSFPLTTFRHYFHRDATSGGNWLAGLIRWRRLAPDNLFL
jgi:DNA replication ATP-dependent helicase Dna2